MKIKKRFQYDGIELRIIERDEPYMNSPDPVKVIRVMAPNGGVLPINIRYKQTLKSIIEMAINSLDVFKAKGADIKHELTKTI